MSEKIEPALTAEEWAAQRVEEADYWVELDDLAFLMAGGSFDPFAASGRNGRLVRAMIALANAALPDSDPRKITRERIAALLKGAVALDRLLAARADWPEDGKLANEVRAFADALESYLPPQP